MPARKKTYKQKLLALAKKHNIDARGLHPYDLETELLRANVPLPKKESPQKLKPTVPKKVSRKRKKRATPRNTPVKDFKIPDNPQGERTMSMSVQEIPVYAELFAMPARLYKLLGPYRQKHIENAKRLDAWGSKPDVNQSPYFKEQERLYAFYEKHFEPWIDKIAAKIKTQEMAQNFVKYLEWVFSEEQMQTDMYYRPSDKFNKVIELGGFQKVITPQDSWGSDWY